MFSCNVSFTLYAPRQSDRLMKFYYPKSCKTDSYIFTAAIYRDISEIRTNRKVENKQARLRK